MKPDATCSKMTPEEFIDQLRSNRELFQWKLLPYKDWTPERRAQPRLHIRAMNPEIAGLMDPIGALCYATTGALHGPQDWVEAAEALHLSAADAWNIMAASTDLTGRQAGQLLA
jgi:hypothetical protein